MSLIVHIVHTDVDVNLLIGPIAPIMGTLQHQTSVPQTLLSRNTSLEKLKAFGLCQSAALGNSFMATSKHTGRALMPAGELGVVGTQL